MKLTLDRISSFRVVAYLFMVSSGWIFASDALCQGPPIHGETPVMLGLAGSAIRSFGRWTSKENSETYEHLIAVPYNISSKMQTGATFPYQFNNPKGSESTRGFGDMSIFLKYQLYKKDGKAKTLRVLARAVQVFPTGRSSTIGPTGLGLYQTYLGVVVGRVTTKVGLYADLGYNMTKIAALNQLIHNLSIGFPLLPQQYPQRQLNAYLSLNGAYQIQSAQEQLFISPGLQWIVGRRLLIESGMQLPIIEKKIPAQEISFRWLIGIRFLIK